MHSYLSERGNGENVCERHQNADVRHMGDGRAQSSKQRAPVRHTSPLRRVSRCVSYAGSVARYSPVIGHLYLPSSPVIGQKLLFG